MCFMCLALGILLTFVTVKTGSIWPAAIMHAVNNTSPSILQFFINPEKVTGITANSAFSGFIYFIPAFVIAVIVLAVWMKNEKRTGKTA